MTINTFPIQTIDAATIVTQIETAKTDTQAARDAALQALADAEQIVEDLTSEQFEISDTAGLQAALDAKASASSLATVATSGSYDDLLDAPPAFSGAYDDLTGKPTLSTVATTGAYADLSGKPTLGTASAQDVGYFATAAQGANGVTAYGWGNHAAAGYLTTIANDAVTNAKLANMAASRIKGRVTGSTGDPEDLTGAQALSIIGTSTAGEIAALTGTKPVIPTAVATLFTRATPSGGSNYAPNFATTRIATWIPTANRVFSNPVNAVPGATIEVKLYASSSTERTVTFGSYYVGDLPTLLIKDTVKYSVFIYCVSATEFVVTAKRLQ